MKRRPTAVRVVVLEGYSDRETPEGAAPKRGRKKDNERTPLIKPGVRPDLRRSIDETNAAVDVMRRAEVGLGRMVELGLPLIM